MKVPGPGTLSVSGKGVVKQRSPWAGGASLHRAVSAAGTVRILIKAKGKAKSKLTRTGKVKIKVRVTYTPTDGTPKSKTPKVKLRKTLRA